MAEKTYEINPAFIGSTVSIFPSKDIFMGSQPVDYIITKDLEKKVLEYLVNIGHPAVTLTSKPEK